MVEDSTRMPESPPPVGAVDSFREAFFRARRAFIREHGRDAFDQAEVFYPTSGHTDSIVVRDAFYGAPPEGPADAFLQRLAATWWTARRRLERDETDGGPLTAAVGLYGHYLPSVGFDFVAELDVDGQLRCWRVDARGRATAIAPPDGELMFHDLTGTFFDVRAGWRALVGRHRIAGELAVIEVESGYVIGVRKGDPSADDPGSRYDPEVEAAFSRMDPHEYDVLEFLGSAEAGAYPFLGERFDEWLGDAAPDVDEGRIDLFVLAASADFRAAVEDLCTHRDGIEVEWTDDADSDELWAELRRGDVVTRASVAYPFLRTLHTGRSFSEGAQAFFGSLVDTVEEAGDLLAAIRRLLADTDYAVELHDGATATVRDGDRVVGRWNLMAIAGRQAYRGSEGEAALAQLIGFDPTSAEIAPRSADLDSCPVTGQPARVGRLFRPQALLGAGSRQLVGAAIGEHFVFYTHETLEPPRYSTPVAAGEGRGLSVLEAAYQRGLGSATTTLDHARALDGNGTWLFVGWDIGSLVLEPGRVRAALEAVGGGGRNAGHGYAFHPDALVVSSAPLDGRAARMARTAALEAVQPRYPTRTWSLDVARALDLRVPAIGVVEGPPS